ncbi:hypothetical protein MAR_037561 [Mya arenaria]|uniref:Uncharacterized protein n=1 Tax=Mya arenaria TaxID=6604 RepID=A0ABY7FS89_MYAAR|nr:hypothetical protein MAR_037561 [Mya arenaria]
MVEPGIIFASLRNQNGEITMIKKTPIVPWCMEEICKTERSSLMMIPPKRNCSDGWTKEYEGYMAAGSIATSGPSEYVCLDGKPEIFYGGGANANGKLLRDAAHCVVRLTSMAVSLRAWFVQLKNVGICMNLY